MTGSRALADEYAAAGFGKRLGYGERPALVVVDVARAYFETASPLYAGVEAVLASAMRVVAAARNGEVPVIFTEVVLRPGTTDGGVFRRKVPALSCFEIGSRFAGLAPQLDVRAGDGRIAKQYASAFSGTPLAANLRASLVDTVVIVGLTTSGCVRATAVDACQEGFIPIVVREAVGDRAPGPQEANLFDLDAKYADVVSERDVTRYLERR